MARCHLQGQCWAEWTARQTLSWGPRTAGGTRPLRDTPPSGHAHCAQQVLRGSLSGGDTGRLSTPSRGAGSPSRGRQSSGCSPSCETRKSVPFPSRATGKCPRREPRLCGGRVLKYGQITTPPFNVCRGVTSTAAKPPRPPAVCWSGPMTADGPRGQCLGALGALGASSSWTQTGPRLLGPTAPPGEGPKSSFQPLRPRFGEASGPVGWPSTRGSGRRRRGTWYELEKETPRDLGLSSTRRGPAGPWRSWENTALTESLRFGRGGFPQATENRTSEPESRPHRAPAG